MTPARLARATLAAAVQVALLPVTIPLTVLVTAERVRVHYRHAKAQRRRLAAIRSLDSPAYMTGPPTWGLGLPEREG